jgi:hypothetical protein
MRVGRNVVATVFMMTYAAGAAPLNAQHGADAKAQVERAALDYLEGFYEGDESKIRRGVHPDVVKVGFSVRRGGGGYESSPMSFQQMLDFARSVKEGGRFPPADAPKDVNVLDVLDQTAAVKVTAWWGSDYLHMARYDGAWKIIHVLWQSPPPR